MTDAGVGALLALREKDALERALELADPPTAARAVCLAPSLERKTTLLWAMDDRLRREVLERVPAALVAALIQNQEDDNRYLLGDLSLEQFRALLDLCSPERKFYWISTALSFTDARANALPLLLTTRELAEILLTRSEFEDHVRALGDFPVEDARIPPEMLADPAQALVDLFGAESFLRQFPVADAALERFLQTLLDYDADRYVDLIRLGLRGADYQENHPLEWDLLTEDPVLLKALDLLEAAPEEGSEMEEVTEEGPSLALVPVSTPRLARVALPPAQRERVADELQYLYIRQAVAEGGSFHVSDLLRAARSVEAYLLLGLQAESGGDPEKEARLLASRPLHRISRTGARLVERLRQVALRLQPMEAVLDAEQRALVRSLVHSRLTLGPEGDPRLQLLPAGALLELSDLPTAGTLLRDVAAWVAMARGMGLERTARALRARGSVDALLEDLALAAVLYGRLEPDLPEPEDRRRFLERYVRGQAEGPSGAASDRLAALPGLPPGALPLLERAIRRLREEG